MQKMRWHGIYDAGDGRRAGMPPVLLAVGLLALSMALWAADSGLDPYDRSYEDGPFKVRVSVDRTRLELDCSMHVRIDAEAPEGFSMEFQGADGAFAQFMKKEGEVTRPALREDGRMECSLKAVLEPILVEGPLALGPVSVRFQSGGRTAEIRTEEVPVQVAVPDAGYWENLDVDSSDSTGLLKASPGWLLPAAVIACLAVLAAAALFIKRRRRKEVPVPPPLPHVVALAELQRIREARLVEKGDIMGFYDAVQGVLRRYIEARFSLRAPERTTEEFLEELKCMAESPIGRSHGRLKALLGHCDLVRFAAHSPDAAEISSTFDECRSFVVESSAVHREADAAQDNAEAGAGT